MKFNEVVSYIEKLSLDSVRVIMDNYAKNHNVSFEAELNHLTMTDFQKRLEAVGVNVLCPVCKTNHFVKNGTRKHTQRYKCKLCGTQFTPFSKTILEKTKWSWEIWVKVLEMTINNYSLNKMQRVLEHDYHCIGIDHKTLFLWQHKLIHALAQINQPTISGVVQIDETFIRESQKGSRNLISFLDKKDVREPRYGYRPSKFGVMGPEFATVTTAVDNTGHCVCYVTGLGKLTPDIFTDLFEKHLNNPAYICTDANSVYRVYCKLFNITHYERPSNYLKIINENGYVTPTRNDTTLASVQEESNKKIIERLYRENLIDHIANKGFLDYTEFQGIKNDNALSLGRVNELHSEIKDFICKTRTNVSTKYLADFIGFFSFIHNWRVDNGHFPSSRKDAENIFIEILKYQVSYTTKDIKTAKIELPKPTSKYITLLKEKTKEARKVLQNKYFKFDEEDNVIDFDKRNYLCDLPKSRLQAICKENGIKNYRKFATWSLVSSIIKLKNINEIILQQIQHGRHYDIAKEDEDYIRFQKYMQSIATY